MMMMMLMIFGDDGGDDDETLRRGCCVKRLTRHMARVPFEGGGKNGKRGIVGHIC